MNVWKKIWGYLSFKKEPEAKGNVNLKLMHGINRISILMFLGGMILLISKCLT